MKKALGLILVLLATFTLVACGGGADKKFVQDALDLATSFTGNPATEGITRDQSFPTTLRDFEGVELTWVSDKPQYLANDGKVTRPEPGKEDEMVTVTVTAVKEKAKDSKEVKFLVKAEIKAPIVKLAQLYDTKTDKTAAQDGTKFTYEYLGKVVEVQGLTVVAKYTNDNGMYLTDGNRLLFVYGKSHVESVEIGKVYDLKGVFGHNFGSAQMSDEKDGIALSITPNTVAGVTEAPLFKATLGEDFIDNAKYDADFLFEPTAYELTAKVIVDNADDSKDYQTFLVAPDYTGYKIVDTVAGGKVMTFDAPVVNVYYAGLVKEVQKLNGRVITAPYFPIGVRTDRGGLNYGVILDEKAIDVKPITEAQEFENMKNLVKANFEGKEFNDNIGKFDFFKKVTLEEGDAEFAWTSNNLDIVNKYGEIVGRSKTDTLSASISVKITYGELEESITVNFKLLKELPLVAGTLEDALKEKINERVVVEVNLAKYEPKNYTITDGTAFTTLRDENELLNDLDLTKTYILAGTISEFNGVKQIGLQRIELAKTQVAHPASTVLTKDSKFADLHAQLVTGEGAVTEVDTDSYDNLYVTYTIGELVVKVKYDSRLSDNVSAAELAKFAALKVGDTVKVENASVISGKSNLYFTSRTIVTVK